MRIQHLGFRIARNVHNVSVLDFVGSNPSPFQGLVVRVFEKGGLAGAIPGADVGECLALVSALDRLTLLVIVGVARPSQNHIGSQLRFSPETDLPINVSGLFYRGNRGACFLFFRRAASKRAMGPASLPGGKGDAAVRQKMGPVWGPTPYRRG